MKTHGESSGDVNEGNMRKSEISKAKEASDHTSQGRTSHDDQITHHVEEDILGVTQDWELLEELNQKKYDVSAQEDGQSAQAKIQKARRFLKNADNKKYFIPREISVGPLHAVNPILLRRELKLKLAKKFIDTSKIGDSTFLQKIKSNIQGLKACFPKWSIPDRYNDDSLARLFFLDGCAVLQFIHSCVRGELEMFKINSTQAAFIQQDLFLLENQIPFQVLTLLMDVMDKDTTAKKVKKRPSYPFKVCTIQFVHENNIFANVLNYYRRRVDIGRLEKIRPAHLLDLLRKVSIFGSIMDVEVYEDEDEDEDERDDGNKPVSITICDQSKKCLSSLECSRKQGVVIQRALGYPAPLQLELAKLKRIVDRSLRNVQELVSSGITMELSNSRGLKSISFNTHCLGILGHLKLPALKVNDATVRKLLNLAAYEMCLDVEEKFYSVTSYSNFLDMLIDTEQDVKKLRRAGVLLNALGSDKEVAQLFNTLGLTYLPKSDEDHFEKIYSKIEEHYARKCKIRMAQIYTAYVQNPWPTLGLLLTLIALLFTVVQTWFAINPRGS